MAQIKTFTPQELNIYFKGGARWHFYEDCKNKREEFLPHSDGVKPLHMIQKQRPNEPDEVRDFRLSIWEPITKPTFSRVVNSLSKIRRSSDWSIIYPKDDFSKIREGYTLEDYCERKYPYFTSVTNWIFSVWLKQYLIDSNGVVLVLPLTTNIDETDYLEPFTEIYTCCDVVDFKEQEYAVLNIPEGCYYTTGQGKMRAGKSFYVVTTVSLQRWDQVDEENNFTLAVEYDHNLGFLPAFKNGGIVCGTARNYFLFESRISSMLPNLNEAIAEYTDLQAGKRLNIYPERWEYTQHECPKCRGVGVLPNPMWREGDSLDTRQTKCTNCVNGYIPSGPFSKMLLRPVELGTQSIPTPPAGFIEKDIEIIRVMDESVDKHIHKALSAINFQFLDQTPLNESGKAKEVDKDELNNTVHGIAEDIVAMMDKIYATIAMYRYSALYSPEEIQAMLPVIPVPEHYDLISSQYMQEEIERSRKAQINSLLISQMEVEFGGKRFAQDPEINKVIKLVHNLDPLPGKTIEEKLAMSSGKTITRESNIISDNIVRYIRRALFENKEFDTWKLDEQQELLVQYADEDIQVMDEASKIAAEVIAMPVEGEEEEPDTEPEPVEEPEEEEPVE